MIKLLTIAVPTYNRSEDLDVCLGSICSQLEEFKDNVELIVSDNCSTDQTGSVVNKYISRNHDLNYVKNVENIGPDANFLQCFNLSAGRYFLLIGDDDVLLPGSLKKILSHIINNEYGVVYLNSYSFFDDYLIEPKKKKKFVNSVSVYKNKNEFVSDVNIMLTFISGNIVNKKLVSEDIDYTKLIGSGIVQIYWYLSAIFNSDKNLFVNDYCIAAKSNNTGGYSVCNVFGVHLITAIEYFRCCGLSKKVENKLRKIILCNFLPIFIIKQKRESGGFTNDDYFNLLYPVHSKSFVFWFVTFPVIKFPLWIGDFWRKKISKVFKLIDKINERLNAKRRKDNGSLLKFKGKYDKWTRKFYNFWLARNLRKFQGHFSKGLLIHPTARLTGLAHMKIGNNFIAGEHLRLEAVARYDDNRYSPEIVIKDNVCLNDFVHIGAVNYVEIGNDVLMASKIYISDHNHGTYSGLIQSDPEDVPSRRLLNVDKKVIIGDRVWIGEFVSILPGVTIGEGSIIAANAVVTKDVPPNCIAAGAPARVIKRYDSSISKWCSVGVV